MTASRTVILFVFMLGLVAFVYGAANHGWYINELNAVFLAIGLVAAAIARISPGETSRTFLEGAAKMVAPALIVGFARAIAIVLEDGQIIDTIVYSIAGLLEGLPAEVSAIGMLVVQSLCNFFIPSGTGQAFVTMPIMNMIVPTSALVMGALALGKVPYTAWFRFVGPLMLKILALAAVFLVLSIHIGDKVGLY
jgi:uncharacterized ion transporter superfamily protein YfcC